MQHENLVLFTELFGKVNWLPETDLKADVSSASPSSGFDRFAFYGGQFKVINSVDKTKILILSLAPTV